MMNYYCSKTYIDDLDESMKSCVGLDNFANSTVLIVGANGLVGSFLVDLLGRANEVYDLHIKIIATGRSIERLKTRFQYYPFSEAVFHEYDVNEKPTFDYDVDYIVHAASNAHPVAFNSDPVGTLLTNIIGTKNLLDYGKSHQTKRFLFVSSGEIYGQGDLTLNSFSEAYAGYIDPLKPRSCYPMWKRAAETLCISYATQFNFDCVIARLCHTYGPNATDIDSKANVQFINDVLAGKDIILKSAGKQMRSYNYIADAGSGIMTILACGAPGHAYNVANSDVAVTIAEFAQAVAHMANRKVVYEEKDSCAIEFQTPIEKQVLCTKALQGLGWSGSYSLFRGIEHTLRVLSNVEYMQGNEKC